MIQFSKPGENIDSDIYGQKAYWINWLFERGYRIPETIFVSRVQKDCYADNFSVEELQSELKRAFNRGIEPFFSEVLARNNGRAFFAVRSSSLFEDGFSSSRAGEFETVLGEMDMDEVFSSYIAVLRSGDKYGEASMGAAVQELVDSQISGIIFSSNPRSFSKRELVLSASEGLGDMLVSGKTKGESHIICVGDDLSTSVREYIGGLEDSIIAHFSQQVEELAAAAKVIEHELDFPVDIEWAVDRSGKLYIIQVRPVSSIFAKEPYIRKVGIESMKGVNQNLIDSDKIRIRLMSEERNVRISDAYLVTVNCRESERNIPKLNIERSKDCRGYSAVMISPKRLNGKVRRYFVGDREKFSNEVKKSFKGEGHQDIKKYPEFESLDECLKAFVDEAGKEFWTIAVLFQEIYDPEYTGIMNDNGNMYIVEFAEGHFAAKGIIPMSRYIVEDGMVTDKNEIVQKKRIRIIEGFTFEERIDREIRIPEERVLESVNKLKPISEPGVITEFGLLETPYLIDVFKENTDFELESIRDGIVSHGKLEGRLVKLGADISEALDKHYYDRADDEEGAKEKLVFFAELPDISFIDMIESYGEDNIGFIFREGSILCHLSILLRERNIPSIIGYDIDQLEEGSFFELEI